MTNRKDKPVLLRILSSISAFAFLGALIFVFFAGFDWVAGAVLASGALGLGVTSVVLGDSTLEVFLGFFEALFDGIMEVLGGILDFLSGIFG
jgi:hypothetical protein